MLRRSGHYNYYLRAGHINTSTHYQLSGLIRRSASEMEREVWWKTVWKKNKDGGRLELLISGFGACGEKRKERKRVNNVRM